MHPEQDSAVAGSFCISCLSLPTLLPESDVPEGCPFASPPGTNPLPHKFWRAGVLVCLLLREGSETTLLTGARRVASRTVVGGGSLTKRGPVLPYCSLKMNQTVSGPQIAASAFGICIVCLSFTSSLSPHPLLWRYLCYSGVKSAWPGLPLQEEGVGGEEGEAGSGPQATPNIAYVQGPDSRHRQALGVFASFSHLSGRQSSGGLLASPDDSVRPLPLPLAPED